MLYLCQGPSEGLWKMSIENGRGRKGAGVSADLDRHTHSTLDSPFTQKWTTPPTRPLSPPLPPPPFPSHLPLSSSPPPPPSLLLPPPLPHQVSGQPPTTCQLSAGPGGRGTARVAGPQEPRLLQRSVSRSFLACPLWLIVSHHPWTAASIADNQLSISSLSKVPNVINNRAPG